MPMIEDDNKDAEEILNEWEEEYDRLQEEAIYNFYSIDEMLMPKKSKGKGIPHKSHSPGRQAVFAHYDKSYYRNLTYMGKKCNLFVEKATKSQIPEDRMARLDVVCKNLNTKTLYRYLYADYLEEELEPKLKDIGLQDYVDLMRAIDMSTAILRIHYNGDVFLLGNLVDNLHSFSISFPRGTFVRKRESNDSRFYERNGREYPTYTYLEIYNGIDGFITDDE